MLLHHQPCAACWLLPFFPALLISSHQHSSVAPPGSGCGHTVVPLSVQNLPSSCWRCSLATHCPGTLVAEALPVQIHPPIITVVMVLMIGVLWCHTAPSTRWPVAREHPQKSEVHAVWGFWQKMSPLCLLGCWFYTAAADMWLPDVGEQAPTAVCHAFKQNFRRNVSHSTFSLF